MKQFHPYQFGKYIAFFSFLGGVLTSAHPVYAQSSSFTFGAAGDFANGSNFTATVNQVKAVNPDFMLALGDLAYTTAEQSWCNTWKSTGVNNILLVSGNHDSGESSSGNINTYVQYCPYTLSTPMTGNYGKEYYFDYPQTSPIARFIMISPGLGGSYLGIDTNYSAGHTGYTFVQNAISDARAKGVKWIIVGEHKNYISTLEKSNEIGTDLMKLLISQKVDLVLQGHEHGYERSKQFALNSSTCTTLTTGSYNADCVVDSDSDLTKGAGTVIHVIGTGGQGLRSINTSDAENPYFVKADITTYGLGKFTLSPTQLTYTFVRSAGGTLADSYTITDSGTPASTPTPTSIVAPTATPRATPTPTTPASVTATPTRAPTPTSAPLPSLTPTPTTAPSSCPQIPTSKGVAVSAVTINTTGSYRVWSRMKPGSDAGNSYWLQIDDNCAVTIGDKADMTPFAWTWVDYRDGSVTSPYILNLTQGTHTIKMIGRESGVRLDRVLFSPEPNGCVPINTGDNCQSTVLPTPTPTTVAAPTPTRTPSTTTPTPVSGDTTPPHVVMVAPLDGATLAAARNMNVAARANDTSGISRIELWVDSTRLKVCKNVGKCSVTFNTRNLRSGIHYFSTSVSDNSANHNVNVVRVTTTKP